jgi:hypothetical protein
MLRVKGIYDGTKIVLLEPVSLAPNTVVEVLIPEQAADAERLYWQKLVELKLITEIRPPSVNDQSFTPIQVTGKPISQTIIEDRHWWVP